MGEGCFAIKLTFHWDRHKINLVPVVLFIHLDLLVFVVQLWRYQLERCLLSLHYNGTRWHFTCGAQSIIRIHLKISAKMVVYRNPGPKVQDNPQT